ncbi:hypothetical protein HRbin01_01899 [archaeon HR01]|nr:hypothetical protein HRbin01_01899 [archaeon HR01]
MISGKLKVLLGESVVIKSERRGYMLHEVI